ncbi:hypothetical protein [Photobacterium leiognathi]|uniref:hypothetical protein n=1 Tax=Photobacterium leiognathi TaxID=553611 RepID=UPI0029813CBA|nr:hypothetical protein [Photobacterium leiognathi]
MYKEIALDPHCMSEFHYYGLLKSAFGFESGRYVIAPTKEWVREAYKCVKASSISPTKQKSVTNFLNKLQREKAHPLIVLPTDRAGLTIQKGYENWLQWIGAQQSLRRFNAVVSEKDGAAYINYEQIIEGAEIWAMPPTRWIDKSIEDIVSVVEPLIHVGRELIIADPYFKLPNNALFKAILKKAMLGEIKKVTLVTTMECSNLSVVFDREYKHLLDTAIKISYVRVPNQFIHDRYVLTDKAAIKAGQGFAVAPEKGLQSDHLSISLCGLDEYRDTKKRIEEYQKQSPESCELLG